MYTDTETKLITQSHTLTTMNICRRTNLCIQTRSLTAALDQLRVVASSTSNDPGPRSGQHQQIGQSLLPLVAANFFVDDPAGTSSQWREECWCGPLGPKIFRTQGHWFVYYHHVKFQLCMPVLDVQKHVPPNIGWGLMAHSHHLGLIFIRDPSSCP